MKLLTTVLPAVFAELVDGSPDPSEATNVLNRGDVGLLASLDKLSAAQASARQGGAPSIAAHVDHVKYGLSILNKWAAGSAPAAQQSDWTASWKKNTVSDDEWRALREELGREMHAWIAALREPRDVSDVEAGWILGCLAHVAYHFGAIRQIGRGARGPTAEDEAQAEAAARARSGYVAGSGTP